jgi:hypothetical protein
MITLQLRDPKPRDIARARAPQETTLESIGERLASITDEIAALAHLQRRSTVSVPSDLMFHAAASLFPPERMAVVAGRRARGLTTLGASFDVTGAGPGTHRAHVDADPGKLRRALIAFELAGVELAAWLHSHPGSGPGATSPSATDRSQYADWTRDFSRDLVAMIVVEDGFARLWGDAIESGRVRAEITGAGTRRVEGYRHVYQLDR